MCFCFYAVLSMVKFHLKILPALLAQRFQRKP